MFGSMILNGVTQIDTGVENQDVQVIVGQLNEWVRMQEPIGRNKFEQYSYSLESLRKRGHEEET